MLTIIQHPFEAGILIALATYGLILAWSLLARLKWLPGAVVRPVHYVLTRLGHLPLLGRAVRATRRHPLSLGLVVAILTGALVPVLLISVTMLVIALTFMAVMYVVIRYGDWDTGSEDQSDPDPYGVYYAHFTNEIVSGTDMHADKSHPVL